MKLIYAALFGLSAALALGSPALAQGEADSLDVYETKHYPVLRLPQAMWNCLIYPLGEFTIYAERTELPQRAHDWFTNDDGTFGLFPQVQLGGETSTGAAVSLFHSNLFGRSKRIEAAYVFSSGDRQRGELAYTDSSLLGSDLYWFGEGEFLKTNEEGATVNGGVEDLIGPDARLFEINRFDVRATVGWLSNSGPLRLYDKGLTWRAMSDSAVATSLSRSAPMVRLADQWDRRRRPINSPGSARISRW